MPAILVQHHVTDFKTWLKGFEEHEPKRKEASVTNASVWQAEDDPNNVIILLECTDLAKIKRFGESEDLKQVMAKVGVIGKPTMTVLTGGLKYPRQAGQHA
jgi:hypothetical protein